MWGDGSGEAGLLKQGQMTPEMWCCGAMQYLHLLSECWCRLVLMLVLVRPYVMLQQAVLDAAAAHGMTPAQV
jgi:hypothetical protein